MASIVPVVPPGANPFTVYRNALNTAFFPTPTTGFRARALVLFVLLGLTLLASFAYILLYIVNARRRNHGYSLWLARMVERPSGAYIVLNAKLVSSLMSIVNCALQAGYVWNIWDVYLNCASQKHSTAWRTIPCIALQMHGWLVSWALLQAYLLAPDQKTGVILSARVANSLFLGGMLVAIGTVLAIGIVSTIAGSTLWDKYLVIEKALKTYEAAWDGTTNVSQLLGLVPQLKDVSNAAVKWAHWESIEYGIVAAVCFVLVMVNLGSVGLTRVLRRQISFKVGQMRNLKTSVATEPSQTGEYGLASLTSPRLMDSWGERPSMDGIPVRITRKEIRGLASGVGTGGHSNEHARGIQALQKAERDLVIISAGVATISLAASSTLLFISVNTSSSSAISIPWPKLEYMFLSVTWAYVVALLFFTSAIIFNAVVNMPKMSPSGDVDTVYMSNSATNATGTIRGFFNMTPVDAAAREHTFPARNIRIQVERERVSDVDVSRKESSVSLDESDHL